MPAALGADDAPARDVTRLTHVRPREEVRAAEEVAWRTPCPDFAAFGPLFARVQRELDTGVRRTVRYKEYSESGKGDPFIPDGQKLVVADAGTRFVTGYDRENRRLRVVYDNGTGSDLLLRSLRRALYKDKASRRITGAGGGSLFADVADDGDAVTGSIHVVRSLSDHPFVARNRAVVHKIGVTGGPVRMRVGNTKKDPTYLLAGVEVVAEYELANIRPKALEALRHRFFDVVRLDVEPRGRFGAGVTPREWFPVPLSAIDGAIQKIRDGTIGDSRYDRESARLLQE